MMAENERAWKQRYLYRPASQAEEAGSIPVICLNYLRNEKPCRCINSICRAFSKLLANFANYCYNNADLERFRI